MIDTGVVVCGLFLLGAALGSFAAATVWRLRVWQLSSDARDGEPATAKDKKQVQKLNVRKKSSLLEDRSICLHCGRELQWYDLLPIASWLSTRGKCRTCKHPIGKMELLAELGLGAAFALSYAAWPYGYDTQGIVLFAIWGLMLVLLAIHWMYDARWFLLLDRVTIGLLLLATLFVAIRLAQLPDELLWGDVLQTGLSLVVLPGFYTLLYLVSRGAWIGFGDVKLLVPFALVVPSWEYGVLLIFLANLIGCVVLLPAILSKKMTRTTRVPFGPFLIAAFFVTVLAGQHILDLYIDTLLF